MKESSKKVPCVPYTRVKGVQTKFRKERAHYGVSIQSLTSMPAARLLHKLTQDGILPRWTGTTCPQFAAGRLGPLKFFQQEQVWVHRCSRKACQERIQPHDFHPIFFGGHGASITPLGRQAAVLLCALAGVPVTSVPVILDMDDKAVFRIYGNLEAARARHVDVKEKDIVFGKAAKWSDVVSRWGGLRQRSMRGRLISQMGTVGWARGTGARKHFGSLLFAAFWYEASVTWPWSHPSSRVASHCHEALEGSASDTSHWWCQSLQAWHVRRHPWQRCTQEGEDPGQW